MGSAWLYCSSLDCFMINLIINLLHLADLKVTCLALRRPCGMLTDTSPMGPSKTPRGHSAALTTSSPCWAAATLHTCPGCFWVLVPLTSAIWAPWTKPGGCQRDGASVTQRRRGLCHSPDATAGREVCSAGLLTAFFWPARGPCSTPGCWAPSTRAWSKRICLASHQQPGLRTSASHLHLFL